MSIGHQFILTGKVISEPKISKGQYGNTAGFAVATTDNHVFYGILKLTSKPNKFTTPDGLPKYLKKMSLCTFYGLIDGYLKTDEEVPSSYMVKFSNAYPYEKGKVLNMAYGTGNILRVAKLKDSVYYKLLMREAKKKMKPTDELKYRYYTVMVPEDVMASADMEALKEKIASSGDYPPLITWAGRIARGETLLGLETDKTKPALNTFLATNLLT